jgi:hypothetical protein
LLISGKSIINQSLKNNFNNSKGVELHKVFGIVTPGGTFVIGSAAHIFLLLVVCHVPLLGSSLPLSLLSSELEEGY